MKKLLHEKFSPLIWSNLFHVENRRPRFCRDCGDQSLRLYLAWKLAWTYYRLFQKLFTKYFLITNDDIWRLSREVERLRFLFTEQEKLFSAFSFFFASCCVIQEVCLDKVVWNSIYNLRATMKWENKENKQANQSEIHLLSWGWVNGFLKQICLRWTPEILFHILLSKPINI